MTDSLDGMTAVLAAGAAITDTNTIDGCPVAVLPDGYRVEDLERLLLRPRQITQNVAADTLESFCRYFNEHKDEASRIFASQKNNKFRGVLDYHKPALVQDRARWGAHSVFYNPQLSEEWVRWTAIDGKPLSQEAFAIFMQENVGDIREPAGATIMEIATGLQAKRSVEFKSGLRLDNGSNALTYVENIQGVTTNGQLEVPEKIKIGIPIYFGGAAYAIELWLRWRLNGGNVSFALSIHRRAYLEQDAFVHMVDAIADATKVQVYLGSI